MINRVKTGLAEEWIVMAVLVFDTLKATKVLKQAGFDEVQAEAVVATVGDAIGGSVATKADLEKTAGELRADMQKMEASLRADISAEFRNLYLHLWIMAAGIIGFNVALMKLIP